MTDEKTNRFNYPSLISIYFILTALGFLLIARFFPEKKGDLVVAFFGSSFGGFLGIAAALYTNQQQAKEAKLKEENAATQAKDTERRAVQQRRIDHIRWLSGILNQVIIYATGQAEKMEVLVDKMNAEPSEVHQLEIIANSSIERLTRADNEATFHAYNTLFTADPERDKHYGELLGTTDFLAAQTAQVLQAFQKYQKSMYERQLQLKAMIEQAANDLATLRLSMDVGHPNDRFHGSPFYTQVNLFLLDYTNLVVKLSPIKTLVADFVNPLLRLLVANKHLEGSNDLTIKLKNINVAFTDLRRESEHSKQAFDPSKLREPVSLLQTVRGRIDNAIKSAETNL